MSRLICDCRMKARSNFSASFLCLVGVLLATRALAASDPPLPRERPETAPQDQVSESKPDTGPSPCQMRLRELASFKAAPPITGPG